MDVFQNKLETFHLEFKKEIWNYPDAKLFIFSNQTPLINFFILKNSCICYLLKDGNNNKKSVGQSWWVQFAFTIPMTQEVLSMCYNSSKLTLTWGV